MYYKPSCFLFCVVFYNANCSSPLYLNDKLHTLSWCAQNKHWRDNQTRYLCWGKKGYNTGHQEEAQNISCGYRRKDHKVFTLTFAAMYTEFSHTSVLGFWNHCNNYICESAEVNVTNSTDNDSSKSSSWQIIENLFGASHLWNSQSSMKAGSFVWLLLYSQYLEPCLWLQYGLTVTSGWTNNDLLCSSHHFFLIRKQTRQIRYLPS